MRELLAVTLKEHGSLEVVKSMKLGPAGLPEVSDDEGDIDELSDEDSIVDLLQSPLHQLEDRSISCETDKKPVLHHKKPGMFNSDLYAKIDAMDLNAHDFTTTTTNDEADVVGDDSSIATDSSDFLKRARHKSNEPLHDVRGASGSATATAARSGSAPMDKDVVVTTEKDDDAELRDDIEAAKNGASLPPSLSTDSSARTATLGTNLPAVVPAPPSVKTLVLLDLVPPGAAPAGSATAAAATFGSAPPESTSSPMDEDVVVITEKEGDEAELRDDIEAAKNDASLSSSLSTDSSARTTTAEPCFPPIAAESTSVDFTGSIAETLAVDISRVTSENPRHLLVMKRAFDGFPLSEATVTSMRESFDFSLASRLQKCNLYPDISGTDDSVINYTLPLPENHMRKCVGAVIIDNVFDIVESKEREDSDSFQPCLQLIYSHYELCTRVFQTKSSKTAKEKLHVSYDGGETSQKVGGVRRVKRSEVFTFIEDSSLKLSMNIVQAWNICTLIQLSAYQRLSTKEAATGEEVNAAGLDEVDGADFSRPVKQSNQTDEEYQVTLAEAEEARQAHLVAVRANIVELIESNRRLGNFNSAVLLLGLAMVTKKIVEVFSYCGREQKFTLLLTHTLHDNDGERITLLFDPIENHYTSLVPACKLVAYKNPLGAVKNTATHDEEGNDRLSTAPVVTSPKKRGVSSAPEVKPVAASLKQTSPVNNKFPYVVILKRPPRSVKCIGEDKSGRGEDGEEEPQVRSHMWAGGGDSETEVQQSPSKRSGRNNTYNGNRYDEE
eukprot:gene26997-33652_t